MVGWKSVSAQKVWFIIDITSFKRIHHVWKSKNSIRFPLSYCKFEKNRQGISIDPFRNLHKWLRICLHKFMSIVYIPTQQKIAIQVISTNLSLFCIQISVIFIMNKWIQCRMQCFLNSFFLFHRKSCRMIYHEEIRKRKI